MKVALLLTAVFTLGTAASAAAETSVTPAEQALVAKPEFREWLKEVGVGARIVGQCERLAPAGAADRYVASLGSLDFDGAPGASEFETRIRAMLLGHYSEGRAAGPSSDLGVAACDRLIKEHVALRAKAEAEFAASRIPAGR